MHPLLQQMIPYGGAAAGSYMGAQAGGHIGTGLGALAGLLVEELLNRRQNQSFLSRLMAILTHERDYNQRLGILAGAALGGGIGSLGGSIGGGAAGYYGTRGVLGKLGSYGGDMSKYKYLDALVKQAAASTAPKGLTMGGPAAKSMNAFGKNVVPPVVDMAPPSKSVAGSLKALKANSNLLSKTSGMLSSVAKGIDHAGTKGIAKAKQMIGLGDEAAGIVNAAGKTRLPPRGVKMTEPRAPAEFTLPGGGKTYQGTKKELDTVLDPSLSDDTLRALLTS